MLTFVDLRIGEVGHGVCARSKNESKKEGEESGAELAKEGRGRGRGCVWEEDAAGRCVAVIDPPIPTLSAFPGRCGSCADRGFSWPAQLYYSSSILLLKNHFELPGALEASKKH